MSEVENKIRQIIDEGEGKRAGCSFEEYSLLADYISSMSPCNLLVFGTGRDSALWELCNSGDTVFLEHISAWIKVGRDSTSCKIYKVKYTTKIKDWKSLLKRNKKSELMMALPKAVSSQNWDVIFVDSPNMGRPGSHGRMQSIYTAAKLSKRSKGTTYVFVHDCDRTVEKAYSNKFLGKKNAIKRVQNMKCYEVIS